MVNVSRLAIGALLLSLLLSGCTGGSDDPKTQPSPRPTTSKAPTLESVAQDLLPGLNDAPKAESNLPARIDIPAQRPPSLMKGPAVAAKLGMVSIDDGFEAEGFAGQNVYFLGIDDRWQILNMADLGLPASDWTGPDGSGMGALSPNGTHWAFATTRHVVVLDLLTKKMQFLSLPDGKRPVSPSWTVRKTLLVGYVFAPTDDGGEDLPTTSYEVDPTTGRSSLIKASALHPVTVLADGNRAIGGLKDDQPFIEYVSATNKPISRRDFGFVWDTPLALQIQRDGADSALFLDSLGSVEPTELGSMVAVVDQSLKLKATLPWPKRTNGDNPIGWIADGTFLVTYGETLAAWCPGQAKIARVSTMSNELAISMAMNVVDAKCE